MVDYLSAKTAIKHNLMTQSTIWNKNKMSSYSSPLNIGRTRRHVKVNTVSKSDKNTPTICICAVHINSVVAPSINTNSKGERTMCNGLCGCCTHMALHAHYSSHGRASDVHRHIRRHDDLIALTSHAIIRPSTEDPIPLQTSTLAAPIGNTAVIAAWLN